MLEESFVATLNTNETAENSADDVSIFLDRLREKLTPDITSTVLVVEDNRMIRAMVVDFILKAAPLTEIVEAENGKDALSRLAWIRHTKKCDPVLIITDLEMPRMDGWALLDELRKDYEAKGLTQGIPVIVLSATDGEKGFFLGRRSIRQGKAIYSPLVGVAKASCINPKNYDAVGDKGLVAWIEYFMRQD